MTVYVMVSEGGPVKIGVTTKLKSRLSTVQCSSPHRVSVVHTVETDGRDFKIERIAHRILNEFRMNGEWFNCSAQQAIDAIAWATSLPESVPIPSLNDNGDWDGASCTTPFELRMARRELGLTQSGLAKALRLSEKNGGRSVRIWETDGNTVPGPVQVAVEFMVERHSNGKTAQ